jgi:hypothetical protein
VQNLAQSQIEALKQSLGSALVSPAHLQPPDGVKTGIPLIDDYLLWKGLPKGEITLLKGSPGSGATSLWIRATQQTHAQSKWTAWINSDWQLYPSYLAQFKVNLSKLLVVKKPNTSSQLFWVLQELISSQIFEMVGCHVQEFAFRPHQLQKLKKLARTFKVALVFVSNKIESKISSLFALIIDCARDFFSIQRAVHRPTPYYIQGSQIYADLMPQLSTAARTLLR